MRLASKFEQVNGRHFVNIVKFKSSNKGKVQNTKIYLMDAHRPITA